ncbi:MAG: CBS domain-containing protein [Spirochaetales bacterium]|nr:CBS domain-containing protein [Spirochaetales bacterium]
MDNKEKFLEIYKKLEQQAILTYGYREDGKAVSNLIRRPDMKDLQVELKAARDLRNILSHYSGEVATPSENLIQVLATALDRVTNKRKAKDIMTPYLSITYATKDSKILEMLKTMEEKGYSYLPILEERRLIGIVTPKTLLSLIASGNAISEETRFDERLDSFRITPLTMHIGFASPEESYESLFRSFRDKSTKSRLDLILITDGGKKDGKLRGLIVPNDLL